MMRKRNGHNHRHHHQQQGRRRQSRSGIHDGSNHGDQLMTTTKETTSSSMLNALTITVLGCMLSIPCQLLLYVPTGVNADDSNNSNSSNNVDHHDAEGEMNFWEFSKCTLGCMNGGRCRFVHGTVDELSRLARSGRLIETCDCLPGYGGTACDVKVDRCIDPGHVCTNGKPCDPVTTTTTTDGESYTSSTFTSDNVLQDFLTGLATSDSGSGGDGDSAGTVAMSSKTTSTTTSNTVNSTNTEEEGWTCNCAEADARSDFAGRMCRNPITEYCSRGGYDPHAAPTIHYCTNGGRCGSDFLSSDTQNDANDTKCRCHVDFYGPHCELLKVDQEGSSDESDPAYVTSTRIRTKKERDMTSGETALLTIFALTVCALAAAFVLKKPTMLRLRQTNAYTSMKGRRKRKPDKDDNHHFTDGVDAEDDATTIAGNRATIRSNSYSIEVLYPGSLMDPITFSDFDEGIVLTSPADDAIPRPERPCVRFC